MFLKEIFFIISNVTFLNPLKAEMFSLSVEI